MFQAPFGETLVWLAQLLLPASPGSPHQPPSLCPSQAIAMLGTKGFRGLCKSRGPMRTYRLCGCHVNFMNGLY